MHAERGHDLNHRRRLRLGPRRRRRSHSRKGRQAGAGMRERCGRAAAGSHSTSTESGRNRGCLQRPAPVEERPFAAFNLVGKRLRSRKRLRAHAAFDFGGLRRERGLFATSGLAEKAVRCSQPRRKMAAEPKEAPAGAPHSTSADSGGNRGRSQHPAPAEKCRLRRSTSAENDCGAGPHCCIRLRRKRGPFATSGPGGRKAVCRTRPRREAAAGPEGRPDGGFRPPSA